jgi:hypothetical protein
MNITGYHTDVSAKEGTAGLLAEASGRQVPGIAGVTDQTDLWPNIMDLSDNILLAHYQRERR